MKDIRELRGRYDVSRMATHGGKGPESATSPLESFLRRSFGSREPSGALLPKASLSEATPSPSDCGVAAIVSNRFIPSHVMDLMLDRMANRGMDGVGIWKGGCYPHHLDHYALHVLVKGISQSEVEAEHLARDLGLHPGRDPSTGEGEGFGRPPEDDEGDHGQVFHRPRRGRLRRRLETMPDPVPARIPRREKQDFRLFGEKDPGDVFRFFVRVRQEELHRFIEDDLLNDPIWPPRQMRYRDLTVENYRTNTEFLQEAEDEYIYRLARKITRENYVEHQQKKAAVLSCGKNSGCWKSDGQTYPMGTS